MTKPPIFLTNRTPIIILKRQKEIHFKQLVLADGV
jgi:hypothetical protein